MGILIDEAKDLPGNECCLLFQFGVFLWGYLHGVIIHDFLHFVEVCMRHVLIGNLDWMKVIGGTYLRDACGLL